MQRVRERVHPGEFSSGEIPGSLSYALIDFFPCDRFFLCLMVYSVCTTVLVCVHYIKQYGKTDWQEVHI